MTTVKIKMAKPHQEKSITHDVFRGQFPFAGMIHNPGGDKDVRGTIAWVTPKPGQGFEPLDTIGNCMREVRIAFVTSLRNGRVDESGVRIGIGLILDHDFIRRLISQDADANAELLKMAVDKSDRIKHFEIHPE